MVRRHHDQLVFRPADVLPSGTAVPSASPFKQESLVSEVTVLDVNSPAVTFGDSESPSTSGDPDFPYHPGEAIPSERSDTPNNAFTDGPLPSPVNSLVLGQRRLSFFALVCFLFV